jgi:hypothetical protein
MANISLRGSERALMRGARVLAPADAAERMEISILVRRRAPQEMQARVAGRATI